MGHDIKKSQVSTAHVFSDQADQINQLTLKGSPVAADVVLAENSAASWAKIRIPFGSLGSGGGGAPVLAHHDFGDEPRSTTSGTPVSAIAFDFMLDNLQKPTNLYAFFTQWAAGTATSAAFFTVTGYGDSNEVYTASLTEIVNNATMSTGTLPTLTRLTFELKHYVGAGSGTSYVADVDLLFMFN